MSNHTPEPWNGKRIDIAVHYFESINAEIALTGKSDEAMANARRIVACVNFCAGVSTENLENNEKLLWLAEQYNTVKAQRDELLRDMQDVLDMLINQPHAVTAANQAEDMLRLSIGTAKYFAKAGAENHSPDIAKMVVPEGLPLVTDSCSALMTLEEAIAHADEKAIGNSQCAAQHAQLAKWLTDYRAMLVAAPKHEGGAS